ncbi:hypothetical protein [Pyrococcus kukulkanii]|nr:hypothetical protein [Pyrococcus kukulkanii]
MGKDMDSDVEKVLRLFQRRETQEAVSEWIVQLAKKIHERPEDIIWFFEIKRLRDEVEKLTETLADEELDVWEEENIETNISLEELIEISRRDYRKFKRIEEKLKELGVV